MWRVARRSSGKLPGDGNPRHIIAVAPNWLGDAVMCTPALRTLHQTWPRSELTVVAKPSICQLYDGLPWITSLVRLPGRAGLLAMAKLRKTLAHTPRDLAVVFPHSFRAALTGRIAGAKRIRGFDRGGRGRLLTDPVPPEYRDGKYAIKYMTWEFLDLIEGLGCQYDGFGPELAANAGDVARVKEHLVGHGPFVGIAPGAAYGPSKLWPAERYARVADRMHETVGAHCVLLTGPGEEMTRDAVQKAARYPLIEPDERVPSLALLKAAVSQLDLLICNDSGPRHVAVAFNVPTTVIMGPTSPLYSEGPYERGTVLRVDVDCGPCGRPVCTTDHRCMTRITVDTVVAAAAENLKRARV